MTALFGTTLSEPGRSVGVLVTETQVFLSPEKLR